MAWLGPESLAMNVFHLCQKKKTIINDYGNDGFFVVFFCLFVFLFVCFFLNDGF
jgi:hypothetical protein